MSSERSANELKQKIIRMIEDHYSLEVLWTPNDTRSDHQKLSEDQKLEIVAALMAVLGGAMASWEMTFKQRRNVISGLKTLLDQGQADAKRSIQ